MDLEVLSDRVVGREGGFLAIRRLRLRSVRADGGRSREYLCDFVERPLGVDAVVVAIHSRADGVVRVLLREALRPALYFGREPAAPPVPDAARGFLLTELVAGVIEPEDRGEDGIRRRAALEVEEEAGLEVAPESVTLLGPPAFLSPGALPEKLHFAAVEVDAEVAAAARPPAGDGSPYEEGARIVWMELGEALAACARGALHDVKTELALRRLRDVLG